MRKKTPANQLAAFARSKRTLGDVFSTDFSAMDDRSLAIVDAADVEEALQEEIQRQINSEVDPDALFLREGAPMGTFSAKIKVAHAFNVVGREAANDLDLIRHIRNAFAHTRKPLTFDTPEVADVCRQLKSPTRFTPDHFAPGVDFGKPRNQYHETAKLLQFSFWFRRYPDIEPNLHPLDPNICSAQYGRSGGS